MKSRFGTEECCGNCNYFCKVRKASNRQEILTHICVLFLVQDKEDYVIETKEDEMCECWMKERLKDEQ